MQQEITVTTKNIEVDGVKFKVSNDGRGWILRGEFQFEICTGTKGTYKKYFVKEVNKTFYLHRLIAEAFIPNPHNRTFVAHKDGNKQNNQLDNLEWATLSKARTNSNERILVRIKEGLPTLVGNRIKLVDNNN